MNMVASTPSGTSGSPGIVTGNSDLSAQSQLLQAMMAGANPQVQAQMQAALALAARQAANKAYVTRTIRKLGPALTNGAKTQAYVQGTPLTFNLSTSLNGYCEGIVVQLAVNYTLAAGASAVYGSTAAGKLGAIDTIEVRYNKSQAKFRPQMFRELALMGALDEYAIPEAVLYGQQDPILQLYLNANNGAANTTNSAPVTVGAQSFVLQFFVPLNLIRPDDPRGYLPLMAGDTGIQVIVNTPQALLFPGDVANTGDAILNMLYPISGTGHAISAVTGTVAIYAVFRDGDTYSGTNKLPFDISLLDGTFQMQIDQMLSPLVANTVQRTKLNIMGKHYYVLLAVVDNVSPAVYASDNNITYIESAKDGIGGNTFWKYGTQTNLSYNDFLFLNRMLGQQDLDPGIIPMVAAPISAESGPLRRDRDGMAYLDNTRTGWADWRYGVQVAATGTASPTGPRIEPHVFYINPTGLVPV